METLNLIICAPFVTSTKESKILLIDTVGVYSTILISIHLDFSRMNVVGIQGESDWNTQLSKAGGKLVVADFSATWYHTNHTVLSSKRYHSDI